MKRYKIKFEKTKFSSLARFTKDDLTFFQKIYVHESLEIFQTRRVFPDTEFLDIKINLPTNQEEI